MAIDISCRSVRPELGESVAERPDARALPEVTSSENLVTVRSVDAWHGPRQVLFDIGPYDVPESRDYLISIVTADGERHPYSPVVLVSVPASPDRVAS